jgi:ABC-type antimicrobial peptide transport system permease subunit
VSFLFETIGDPSAMVPAIKREMRAAAPGYAELTVNTLKRTVRDALYQDWLQAVLSIALALVGVGLAAVGLVGVVSQSVTRRRREIGIRTAIGAQRRDIVLMVLKQGLVLSGVGAALGVGMSLLVGQAMSSLLFGVSPRDPIVIGLSATLAVVIGLLGSAYPAWKASRVDPVHVLRAE